MKLQLAVMCLMLATIDAAPAEDRTPRSWLSSPQPPPYASYRGFAQHLDETAADEFFSQIAVSKKEPLVAVSIHSSAISDRGAQSLATSRFPIMTISTCQITRAGFESVLSSKHLRSLVAHRLPLDKVDFANLSAPDSQVAYLEIITSQLDDESLMTLAPSQKTFQLQLQNSRLRGPGLAVLKKIPKLLRLEIGRNPIDDEGLANLPPLPELVYLSLDATKVTDVGLKRLSPMSELKQLDLSDTAMTGAGLGVFTESRKLARVILKGTKVGDSWLADFPDWPELDHLDLNNTNVSDAGLGQFHPPDSLKYLRLGYTKATPAAMQAFTMSHPQVRIGFPITASTGMMFYKGVRKDYDETRN